MKNNETEFGYSKYSFENIEKNSNLLNYKLNLPLYFSLRKMGNFSFDAVYKYNKVDVMRQQTWTSTYGGS